MNHSDRPASHPSRQPCSRPRRWSAAAGPPPPPMPPTARRRRRNRQRTSAAWTRSAKAAKEGTLNAIALAPDWANYGAIIDGFKKKYGIKVADENPDGASQDEINAITSRKGQDRAPDVVDLGSSFALSAAQQGLLAPYKVASCDDSPRGARRTPQARWYNDYGGYISIGCDAKRVKVCPTTFADLLKPQYKGQVALNGNPTKSGSAFGGVYAASLASGGSFDDIQPGLDFFAKLKKNGNFNPVESTPATVEKGETPISIDWDYLNAGYADEFGSKGVDWKVAVPPDGQFAQYYSQAINKDAPHPAAARLWQEYLYSAEGQNLWLKGYARPVADDRHGEGRHPRQDGRRQAARGLRHALLPDRGPAEQGQDRPRAGLGQGRLRMTVHRRHAVRQRRRRRRPLQRRRRSAAAGSPSSRCSSSSRSPSGCPPSPCSTARSRSRTRRPAPLVHGRQPDRLGARRLPDRAARQRQAVGRHRGARRAARAAAGPGRGDLALPRAARGRAHRLRRARQLRRRAAGLRLRRHPRQRRRADPARSASPTTAGACTASGAWPSSTCTS